MTNGSIGVNDCRYRMHNFRHQFESHRQFTDISSDTAARAVKYNDQYFRNPKKFMYVYMYRHDTHIYIPYIPK